MAPKLGYEYGKETKTVPEKIEGTNKMKLVDKEFNYEFFTFYCPSCGFRAFPFDNIIAAISCWHTTNTPGNEFYADRWIELREKQKAEEMAAA